MKKLLTLSALAGAMLLCGQVKAQDITKGNLAFLKGVDEINVSFVYTDLKVGKEGKEANYIKKKKAEREAKEPGKGADWEKSWYDDRPKRYEPRFILLFGKYAEMKIGDEDVKGKYTMVVDTKFIEPGYNVGISSGAAVIDLDISIFDASDMTKPLCKIRMDDVKGGKGQFDTGMRIGEAYAKAGKELGKLVAKKAK